MIAVEEVRDWLRSKNCTLWGNWCIDSRDELNEAAAWFAMQMSSFEDFSAKNRHGYIALRAEQERQILAEQDRVASMKQQGLFEVVEARELPPPTGPSAPLNHPKEYLA